MTRPGDAVIEVANLTYKYGSTTALRDMTFSVPQGAIYALLGPNGSGKTTLLQVLMGLRRARVGRASVLGRDVGTLTAADRDRPGISPKDKRRLNGMKLRDRSVRCRRIRRPGMRHWQRDCCASGSVSTRYEDRAFARRLQMKVALFVRWRWESLPLMDIVHGDG